MRTSLGTAIDALEGIGVVITHADANLDAQQRLCELFEPAEHVFRALRGVRFKGIDMFPCSGGVGQSGDGDEGDGIPTGGGIIPVVFLIVIFCSSRRHCRYVLQVHFPAHYFISPVA